MIFWDFSRNNVNFIFHWNYFCSLKLKYCLILCSVGHVDDWKIWLEFCWIELFLVIQKFDWKIHALWSVEFDWKKHCTISEIFLSRPRIFSNQQIPEILLCEFPDKCQKRKPQRCLDANFLGNVSRIFPSFQMVDLICSDVQIFHFFR